MLLAADSDLHLATTAVVARTVHPRVRQAVSTGSYGCCSGKGCGYMADLTPCLQIGMPPAEQVINATLDYQMSVSGYNVRKFINTAVEGMDLGPYGSVVEELTKAVDEIEQQTGAPLDGDNDKGWDSLKTKIEVNLFVLGGFAWLP